MQPVTSTSTVRVCCMNPKRLSGHQKASRQAYVAINVTQNIVLYPKDGGVGKQ